MSAAASGPATRWAAANWAVPGWADTVEEPAVTHRAAGSARGSRRLAGFRHGMSVVLLLVLTCTLTQGHERSLLIREVGSGAGSHKTVLCDPADIGSVNGCFDQRIKSLGNDDLPWGHPQISYPKDGTPWGIHLTGPYPDGLTYLVSWLSGQPVEGVAGSLPRHDPAALNALVQLSTKPGAVPTTSHGSRLRSLQKYRGSVIRYTRSYASKQYANHSYLSPCISHVVLSGLRPSTTYYYAVRNWKVWSKEMSFTTLPGPTSAKQYPLRIGLMADIGQSVNSSVTRDRLISNKPQVILHVGDNAYADLYSATSPDEFERGGTNQHRWDSYAVMMESLFSQVPVLNCIGNHEIEDSGIAAVINYKTTFFAYPNNYPFQSYAARYPVPGVTSEFGSINHNLFYSTTLAGKVKLITLNNYIPFHAGTPQYIWALKELADTNRTVTPWLIVQLHASPYHTYYHHYKEMECFLSIWEDIFYMYGVDLVLSGHVHAYERTHPVYQYSQDECAPAYITVGDGGNVEGPSRYFVDQVNPLTNKTYCAMLRAENSSLTPRQVHKTQPAAWGPASQRAAHPPNCPTTSWQPPNGIHGGSPLHLLGSTNKEGEPLGFCQSSQPDWSAHRDPSFGHGLLELLDDNTAELHWYRNSDPAGKPADKARLERSSECSNLNPATRNRHLLHRGRRTNYRA